MTPRTVARRAIGALLAAGAIATLPAIGHADPLAVLIPDAPAAAGAPAHPDASERIRLADAVSGVLGRALPDVLSAGESRSRVEVLDPSLLVCAVDACAARVATVTHARVVVLVRATVSASTLHLELVAVDPAGHEIAQASDETALADWNDALALASVLAGRLIPALRPAPAAAVETHPANTSTTTTTTAPVVPDAVEHTRSAPRVVESVVGGALVVAGLALGIVDTAIAAQGTHCTSDQLTCSPVGSAASLPAMYSSPNAVAYVGIVGGYAAAVVGAVLLVHGLTAREVVAAGASARRTHGLRVLGVRVDASGVGVTGAF